VANSAMNWSSAGMALLSSGQVTPNQPPVASFTVSCTTTSAPCAADASASQDPDGSIAGYAWSWGDGTTTTTTGPTTSHTYSASGTYSVQLTVTDNKGATGSATQSAHVTSTNAPAVAFRAAATYDANTTSAHVTVPASVQAGDELLLFETEASATNTATAPAGWKLLGTSVKGNLSTAAYSRPATASDAGSSVTVPYSATVKASLTLAAYANAGDPVEASASASDASTTSHKSPSVTGLASGSYAITFWGDKATTTSAWTAPSGVTQRAVVYGSGGGAVSALLVDSGAAVTGSYGGLTATTNATSGSGTSWTIGLAPAG
jgi:PKD repeat protein